MKIMLLAILPSWNSLDSVRQAHGDLELAGLVFFALLVIAEACAHNSEQDTRKRLFDSIGIWFFAVAVLCEIAGYWYGRRNDFLSEKVISSLDQKTKDADRRMVALDNRLDTTSKEAGTAEQKVAILRKQANTLEGKIRQAKLFADIALARTHPRIYRMDAKIFVSKLRGVIPFNVEIRYKPNDTEAHELAEKISQALGKGFDGTGKDGLGWKVIGPLPLTQPFSGSPFGGGFSIPNASDVGDPSGGAAVWKLSEAMDASGIHFPWITQDVSVPAGTVRVIVLSQFD